MRLIVILLIVTWVSGTGCDFPTTPPTGNTNGTMNGNTNGNTNENTNENTNGNTNENTNGNTNENTNGNTNGDTNENTNGDTNDNGTGNPIPPIDYGVSTFSAANSLWGGSDGPLIGTKFGPDPGYPTPVKPLEQDLGELAGGCVIVFESESGDLSDMRPELVHETDLCVRFNDENLPVLQDCKLEPTEGTQRIHLEQSTPAVVGVELPFAISVGAYSLRLETPQGDHLVATVSFRITPVEFGQLATDLCITPTSEFGTGLVLTDEEDDSGELLFGSPADVETLKSSIDLSDWLPPAGNQGLQNSCVGFALGYGLKSYQEAVEASSLPPSSSDRFSPSYIYSRINDGNCSSGSDLVRGFDVLYEHGCLRYTQAPYDADSCAVETVGGDSPEPSSRISDFHKIDVSETAFKANLAQKIPIVIGIEVYKSWFALDKEDAIYSSFVGSRKARHALLVVGYDDDKNLGLIGKGAIKVFNSYGDAWGEDGYAWIPYASMSEVILVAYVAKDVKDGQDDPKPKDISGECAPNAGIYWVDSITDTVNRLGLDDDLSGVLVADLKEPKDLAFDEVNGHIYWTDQFDDSIWRANLDGTQPEQVIDDLRAPEGIALDVENGMIYWSDWLTDSIECASFSKVRCDNPVVDNLSSPEGIALDLRPESRRIYWADSIEGAIFAARIDDGGAIVTIASGLRSPQRIALDLDQDQVFWTDNAEDAIFRVSFQGEAPEGLEPEKVVSGLKSPEGIALDLEERHVYWTDRLDDSVKRTNMNRTDNGAENDDDIDVLKSDVPSPEGIRFRSGTELCPPVDPCESSTWQLYWADHGSGSVLRAQVDPTLSAPEEIVTQVNKGPRWVAVDNTHEKVYWTHGGFVSRSNLDGGMVEIFANGERYNTTEGIAVDADGTFVYWTDAFRGKLSRRRTDASDQAEDLDICTTLCGQEIEGGCADCRSPSALAIHPTDGSIYWTDPGAGIIYRMQGFRGAISKIWPVTGSTDATQPYGIALDAENGWLYWTDRATNSIRRASLVDGSNVTTVRSAVGGGLVLRNDPDFAFWTSGPGIFRRGADWTDAAPIATGQEPQGLALAELGQCKNDLVFCNGKEICFDGKCSHVGNPCGTDSLCDEEAKRCVCTSATGCASPLHCDVSTGNCVECLNDQDCNDGDFCDPLTAECVACLIDEHCDDGDYCNGLETCLDQTCVAGQSPCADGETCLPAENACVIVLLDCETPLDPARIVHQGAAEPPKCTSAEPPELPGSVLELSWSFAETEDDAFIVLVFDEVSVAPGDRITLDIVVEDQQTVRFEMKTAGMQTICATSRQFEQSTTYTMEFDVCTPMNIAELGLVIESDPGVQVVSQSRFWIDNVQIRR